jgi:hypothetical protein
MAVTHELYAALASGDRLESLRRAAERELEAGASREQLVAALEELRGDLRRVGGRDEDDDVVLEVMDFVNGWCSPHMRL